MAIYYPRKKIIEFSGRLVYKFDGNKFEIPPGEVPFQVEWRGVLNEESPSLYIDFEFDGAPVRRFKIEDWANEPLQERDFSLEVVIDEEFTIQPVFSLQVSDDGTGDEGELHFLLERMKISPNGLVLPPSGGSLFERGLAVQGMVNPITTRYSVQCENCGEGFTFRASHTGLEEIEYLYCEKSSQVLCMPTRDPLLRFKRPDANSKPVEFSPSDIAQARLYITYLESLLPLSDHGGHFMWLAPFRCPGCLHPLIDFRNNLFRKAWECYVCIHKGYVVREFAKRMLHKKDTGKAGSEETEEEDAEEGGDIADTDENSST